MIVITGATGKLGQAIVEALVARIGPDVVGVSVRDPVKADALATRGVRVRRGDFADPATLPGAFEGAEQLLLVSSNAAAYGGDPLAQHRSAINAAITAGVRRIVYTSHMGVSATSAFPPMRDHHATEAMLRESGVRWTALRNGFYAASGVQLIGESMRTGVVQAPADGPVSWTAHADLAEAAAVVLADQGRFDGATPPLTGAEALDLHDIAAIASEQTGRAVERRVISDDDMRARMAARGAPSAVVEIALGLYAAARAGEFQAVDPTLARLIGRAPTPMREVVRQALVG